MGTPPRNQYTKKLRLLSPSRQQNSTPFCPVANGYDRAQKSTLSSRLPAATATSLVTPHHDALSPNRPQRPSPQLPAASNNPYYSDSQNENKDSEGKVVGCRFLPQDEFVDKSIDWNDIAFDGDKSDPDDSSPSRFSVFQVYESGVSCTICNVPVGGITPCHDSLLRHIQQKHGSLSPTIIQKFASLRLEILDKLSSLRKKNPRWCEPVTRNETGLPTETRLKCLRCSKDYGSQSAFQRHTKTSKCCFGSFPVRTTFVVLPCGRLKELLDAPPAAAVAPPAVQAPFVQPSPFSDISKKDEDEDVGTFPEHAHATLVDDFEPCTTATAIAECNIQGKATTLREDHPQPKQGTENRNGVLSPSVTRICMDRQSLPTFHNARPGDDQPDKVNKPASDGIAEHAEAVGVPGSRSRAMREPSDDEKATATKRGAVVTPNHAPGNELPESLDQPGENGFYEHSGSAPCQFEDEETGRPLEKTEGDRGVSWWQIDLCRWTESGATRLLHRCIHRYGWTYDLAMRVLCGYRQFLEMKAAVQDWDAEMVEPPTLVNQMWKQHVLDNRNYHNDCRFLYGHEIIHKPDGGLETAERLGRIEFTKFALTVHFPDQFDSFVWNFENDPS